MKKVAIIFGSPRKNSNTHILVKEAQKGLSDKGIDSEIFFLNDMDIKGCQACYYCKTKDTTECALKDDMQKIYKAIEQWDGIIVATPIYFCDVTAQTKLWLDRLFPYIDMNINSKLPKGKKCGFIFTQNQPNPNLFLEHINTFKNVIQMIGFDLRGDMLAYNLDKDTKPMVTEKKDFMQKAYDLGKNLLV